MFMYGRNPSRRPEFMGIEMSGVCCTRIKLSVVHMYIGPWVAAEPSPPKCTTSACSSKLGVSIMGCLCPHMRLRAMQNAVIYNDT